MIPEGSNSGPQAVALSSEERLALENINFGDGLSDTTTAEIVTARTSKKCKVRNVVIPTPKPKNRDAMGNYVPPPGEKPLSSLGYPTPGPQYDPNFNLILKQSPVYSLGGTDVKYLWINKGNGKPGPNKYNTGGDLLWGKCRTISLKHSADKKFTTPGPGPSTATMKPFKPVGPMYSMATKPKKPPVVFARNPHVMPAVSDNPGPEFKPSDETWLDKPRSLGVRHRDKGTPPGPGPGKYNTDNKVKGPSYSLGKMKDKKRVVDGPGPAKYQLKTTIGDGPKAPLGGKYREIHIDNIPGPDVYHRAGFRLDEPGYTMKYRWFDSDPLLTPGPSDYMALLPSKGPAFTIKQKNKDVPTRNPGPADYNPVSENWKKPGKSFGLKWTDLQRKAATRSPDYLDPEIANRLVSSGPSYSFRKSDGKKKGPKTPGPCAYTPKLPGSKQTITLGKKIPIRLPTASNPSPAQTSINEESLYFDPNFPKIMGARATSLKGRHTPLKYTGQRDSALLKPPPKEIACAPFF